MIACDHCGKESFNELGIALVYVESLYLCPNCFQPALTDMMHKQLDGRNLRSSQYVRELRQEWQSARRAS